MNVKSLTLLMQVSHFLYVKTIFLVRNSIISKPFNRILMSQLTLPKRNLFPSWTTDLFNTEKFFTPGFMGFDSEFPEMDFARRMPSVNITENDKDFLIEMAAPGLERKDFKVEIENGVLFIRSEKKEEKKEETKTFARREFSYNSFSRSFTLPENCLPEKILAHYENGILSITLPKKEMTFAHPIKEIKVS